MAFLYQLKNIFLALALINVPYARTQGIDDIVIKGPPTAPATYNQCRDYCTLSGIRSARCITNPAFYEGDWSILTAADWSCLCDNDHYVFYSVIVGRSCGVWPTCGPVSSQIDLEYRDNCTAAAQRYNGTKPPTTGTYTGWPSTESPPYPTASLPPISPLNSSQSSYGNTSFTPTLTTFTAFTTITSTITSCPVPPNGCSIGHVVASTSALYTTTCPVTNSLVKTTPGATSPGTSASPGVSPGSSGAASIVGGAGSGSTVTTGKPAAAASTGKPATTSSVLQAAGAPMLERKLIWGLLSTIMVGLFAFAEL